MRVAITGAHGFLGWHTACRLRARYAVEPVRLGRAELADPDTLDRALAGVDAVVHVAGVNRAASDDEVEQGNVALAETLADAVHRADRPLRVSYADSVQAGLDNAYGRGKARAAEVLDKAVSGGGGRFTDVVLPNVFGEHGRPAYNSFVATFADAVAHDRTPSVTGDREVPLLHVQAAAEELLQGVLGDGPARREPAGERLLVSEVLDRLVRMHALYRDGEVPPLTTALDVDLFNTYRACRFPDMFPLEPPVHADPRGRLVETSRTHGGTGQSFVSTTVPGATRGDHYHLHKVERFFVVRGRAEIRLRRLLHDDVVTFRLDGERPAYVDMPTLWTHNITNVGDEELVTVFWADQLLDPAEPDQYAEAVSPS